GNAFRHPHDFILQVVFDWGAVGGGAFLVLLTLAVGAALKLRHKATAAGRVGMFGAVCMLGYAGLDGILFYPYTIGVTLVFMVTALALSGARAVSKAGRTGSEALKAA